MKVEMIWVCLGAALFTSCAAVGRKNNSNQQTTEAPSYQQQQLEAQARRRQQREEADKRRQAETRRRIERENQERAAAVRRAQQENERRRREHDEAERQRRAELEQQRQAELKRRRELEKAREAERQRAMREAPTRAQLETTKPKPMPPTKEQQQFDAYLERKEALLKRAEKAAIDLSTFAAAPQSYADRVIKLRCSLVEGPGNIVVSDDLGSGRVHLLGLTKPRTRKRSHHFAMHAAEFKAALYTNLAQVLPESKRTAGPQVTVTVWVWKTKSVNGEDVVYGRVLKIEG